MTQALQGVQELLHRDFRMGVSDGADGLLTGFEREGLQMALSELCGGAMNCLEDLRETPSHWRARAQR